MYWDKKKHNTEEDPNVKMNHAKTNHLKQVK